MDGCYELIVANSTNILSIKGYSSIDPHDRMMMMIITMMIMHNLYSSS